MLRTLNEPLVTDGDMSDDIESSPVDLEQMTGYSIQAVYTGSPVGTLTLQGSNDYGTSGGIIGPSPSSISNWTTISGSDVSVTTAGDSVWNVQYAYYRWVRLVYTSTSGTGTLNARLNSKGF